MNRSRILFLAIVIMLVQTVSGQQYFTHGTASDLHLIHKVAAKDTWFSLGRTYNLTPKEIANFNNLSIDKPLEIGQSVKIPLNSKNFSQSDPTGSVDDLVPIYHEVQEKEWMYRISVNHNKVPIEKLERWNNITRDQAKAGMKLIVGFLNNKETGSVTSSSTTAPPAASSTKTPTVSPVAGVSVKAGEGGYFKTQYDDNGKNQSGVSGIFKSTSGWKDGKYYALMNNVTVGTIVKVNYPSTNKSIYAKVLGELPDMKESAGLALRISDAAAKELGAVTNKFPVQVVY